MIQPSRTYDTGHGNSFRIEEWDLPYKVTLLKIYDQASLETSYKVMVANKDTVVVHVEIFGLLLKLWSESKGVPEAL